MPDLITVEAALKQILDGITPLSEETIATSDALGRVLAGDIRATIDLPPFANSSMDGYAIHAIDSQTASENTPVQLPVVDDIPAGSVSAIELLPGSAARIMTGAPLPPGADAVIPMESTDDQWLSDGDDPLPSMVQLFRAVKPGDYVRPAGEDVSAGQLVLKSGTVLRPQDIGVLVSLGHAAVPVFRRPRVVVLATGDELVDVHERLGPGQIRNSNSYVLASLVTAHGGEPIRLPTARDNLDDVRDMFERALEQKPDLIISSAGVSVGTRDVVRTVVDEIGHLDLWRVNVRPGKPLAFGEVQGVPYFGLPGNPVSAMVTFDIFVRPVIALLSGCATWDVPTVNAVLAEDVDSDGRRSYLRVTLTRENGELMARLTGTQSSGALFSMVLADGLLVIPEGITHAAAGISLPVRLLRPLGQHLG